jgi:hypothetical protein|tara:strand:- start:197 stop:823 length:627 start_codon:yes stop_codon:yes gene_type:complete
VRFISKKYFHTYLLIIILSSCSFSSDEKSVLSIMDTDKGKELGEEALDLTEGKVEAVSEEDSPVVLAQCLRDKNYNVSDPKNFLDLYFSVSAIFEELSQTEQEELWNIIEDCAETYNLWGVNDEQEWEDPAEQEKRWDFNLHMAECFRDQGYDNVADPNPFNPEIDLSFYIDDDWELREEDPIVQTWMKCEEVVEEEHGLTEVEEDEE